MYTQKNADLQSHQLHPHIHKNRLPINLLHSPTQYNRILIKNKRTNKNSCNHLIADLVESLEFINDPIFQKYQQKNQTLKSRNNSSEMKLQSSLTLQCQCCQCGQICSICNNQGEQNYCNEIESMTHQQIKKEFSQIKSKKEKRKKNKKQGENQKNLSKKLITEPRKSVSYFCSKSFKIDHLICDSLVKFQEEKRQRKIEELRKQRLTQNHRKTMKILEDAIRQKNKLLASPKSKQNTKPISPFQIRMDYWLSAKQQVSQQLKKKKSKLFATKQAQKSSDQYICDHNPKRSESEVQTLRKKYEKRALKIMKSEKMEKKKQHKDLKKKLKKLQRSQKSILKDCLKKKFKPSQQTIETAFTNLMHL